MLMTTGLLVDIFRSNRYLANPSNDGIVKLFELKNVSQSHLKIQYSAQVDGAEYFFAYEPEAFEENRIHYPQDKYIISICAS